MNIFITGASGFVAGAYVREAKDRHNIRAMSRSEKSDTKIREAGAEPVRCSLDDVTAEHLKGADAVVHCAAYVEEWGPWRAYWRMNVDGTKRMLAAAKKAGVKRFIHIGTEAALLRGQDLRGADETYPLALNSPFPYSRTKAHAEKAVRAANAPGFETIVVRPRFVWGPGDETLMPAIRGMVESGGFAWVGGGRARTSTTYIGNLTHAMELALTRGKPGEAYFVLDDGGAISFRDMIGRMAAAENLVMPDREMPAWLARAVAFLAEKTWRILPLPGRPPLTRFTANIMSRDCILIDEKARREMGYTPPYSREAGFAAMATAAH